MATLCGILGRTTIAPVESMLLAMRHRADACRTITGDTFVVAGSHVDPRGPCLLDGSVSLDHNAALSPEQILDAVDAMAKPQSITFQGHFSLAVRHAKSEHWWLLRDRAGVKPLYYYRGENFLLFASELKALLASGLVPRRLNLLSVDRYLTLRCVPGPDTIIQGVRRVRPGNLLRYGGGEIAESPIQTFDLQPRPIARADAEEGVRHHLRDALATADADGVLWGAGLDTAAIAAIRRDIPPIYIALEKGWRDESRHAEESAHILGCELSHIAARRLTENTFAHVARSLDEPIADATVLPLWLIMQRAAEHGKRILTSHGADQLFGGSQRYRLLAKTREARLFVPSRLVTEVLPALPPNAFIRRGSRYLARIRDNMDAYFSLLSVFDAEEREELYTSAMKSAIHEQENSVEMLREHFRARDMTDNVLALDLHVGLPDLVLAECDRISSAHGVTLQFPYLEHRLVDFMTTVPAHVKYGVRSNSLLRHAMKGIVPARIRLRPQRSFRIPEEGRVMGVIENAAAQIVTQDRVESAGIFRWQHVEQVLRSAGHNIYRRRQFWALLMFFAWYREVMER